MYGERSRVGRVQHNKLSLIETFAGMKIAYSFKACAPAFFVSLRFSCARWSSIVFWTFFYFFLQYANLININCAVSRSQKRTEWQRQLKFKCSLHFFLYFFRHLTTSRNFTLHVKMSLFGDNVWAFCCVPFFRWKLRISMHRCTMQWIKNKAASAAINFKWQRIMKTEWKWKHMCGFSGLMSLCCVSFALVLKTNIWMSLAFNLSLPSLHDLF